MLRNLSIFKAVLLTSSAILCVGAAAAQAQVQIPGAADSGRVDDNIIAPQFDSVTTPRIDIPEVTIENAPDGAENIVFVLNTINLEGVTAYSQEELRQIYDSYLGKEITLTTIYEIAQKITRKYRNEGYLITQAIVPQQTIDGGNVTIRVVEGFIDQVIVEDSEDTLASYRLQSIAQQLTAESPLTAQNLERWLLLINDLAGVSARSIISPSQTTVGGADIRIIPSRDPYNFSVGVDNFGSRYLGPWQATAAAQFNNLFNASERMQIQYARALESDELIYGSGLFELPINAYGTRLRFDMSYSDTEPGFDLEIFEVNGRSTRLGVEAEHPIIRSRTQNMFGSLRLDWHKQTSSNIVDAFQREDKIVALRAGLDYNVIDTLWRPAVNEFSMTLSQGIDLFNASDENDANMSRVDGDPQFTKIEAEIKRLQTLTSNLNLLTAVHGQYAYDPLLSSEEFGLGGRDYGRGYDPSEIVGDHGIAAKIEMQWNSPYAIDAVDNYQLFGFYDVGRIWNEGATNNATGRASLASTGVGVRADINETFSGEFMTTFPMTRDVATEGDTDPRFFIGLSANF